MKLKQLTFVGKRRSKNSSKSNTIKNGERKSNNGHCQPNKNKFKKKLIN